MTEVDLTAKQVGGSDSNSEKRNMDNYTVLNSTEMSVSSGKLSFATQETSTTTESTEMLDSDEVQADKCNLIVNYLPQRFSANFLQMPQMNQEHPLFPHFDIC